MPLFSYHPKAVLHVCNECLSCDRERYKRLKNANKITESCEHIFAALIKYRFLTLALLSVETGIPEEELRKILEGLEEYGLIIRQYFKYECEREELRTPVFYCMSANLPFDPEEATGEFQWSKNLVIAEAMSVLNYNLFHLIVKEEVPRKAIQMQTNYRVGDVVVNGRYRLKGRNFFKGYSHCMILSVCDFSEQNNAVAEKIRKVTDYYSGKEEKVPWFVIICENSVQAAHISKKIIDKMGSDYQAYFLFANDLEFGENPFHTLQKVSINGNAVEAENYLIEDWYEGA